MARSEFQSRDGPENARRLVVLRRTRFPARAGLSQRGLECDLEPCLLPRKQEGAGVLEWPQWCHPPALLGTSTESPPLPSGHMFLMLFKVSGGLSPGGAKPQPHGP